MIWGPFAVFAGGPSVEVGQSIQFSDNSTQSPTSWNWDFDYDGLVPNLESALQNPVHAFTEVRTYQVYLEVCNFIQCDSVVKDVIVTLPDLVFEDGFETGDLANWIVGESL